VAVSFLRCCRTLCHIYLSHLFKNSRFSLVALQCNRNFDSNNSLCNSRVSLRRWSVPPLDHWSTTHCLAPSRGISWSLTLALATRPPLVAKEECNNLYNHSFDRVGSITSLSCTTFRGALGVGARFFGSSLFFFLLFFFSLVSFLTRRNQILDDWLGESLWYEQASRRKDFALVQCRFG